MADDIVARLRSQSTVFYEYAADDGALLRVAADEIERVRICAAQRIGDLERFAEMQANEIERLRAKCAKAQEAYTRKLRHERLTNSKLERFRAALRSVLHADVVPDEIAKLASEVLAGEKGHG